MLDNFVADNRHFRDRYQIAKVCRKKKIAADEHMVGCQAHGSRRAHGSPRAHGHDGY